jgi:hypothetical protein
VTRDAFLANRILASMAGVPEPMVRKFLELVLSRQTTCLVDNVDTFQGAGVYAMPSLTEVP